MAKLPEDLDGLVGGTVHAGEYHHLEYRGSGKRGHVFRAERKYGGERALKFIPRPKPKLAPGWEEEARKAHLLEGQPNTVRFHDIFFHEENYYVLVFDFVDGTSLYEWIKDQRLGVSDIELVLLNLLSFRRDCLAKCVDHGDLHPGNIILRKPRMGQPRSYEVMVTDFGIGYTGAVLQPKDDFIQIGNIATRMLQSINREALDHIDRVVYDELCHGSPLKALRETSPLERGDDKAAKATIDRLMRDIEQVRTRASMPIATQAIERRFGDYLAGEQLGDRWKEWKDLFVCNFPGYEDVVSRNIAVLTGTRGCGKTMVFRRLSALLTFEVGQIDEGAEIGFIGFYLNMNDIGDAFLFQRRTSPNERLARRVIQFFHLSMLSEIVRVAGVATREASPDVQAGYGNANRWLFEFVTGELGSESLYPGEQFVTSALTSELERAKDEVRSSRHPPRRFAQLGDNDWLTRLVPQLQEAMPWVGNRPVYFFVDDYSLPRVNETLQTILNSVIFRRSDSFFFKIATESPSTFHRTDYSGKELQDPDDFELTDLGSITIDLSDVHREQFLDEIFERRFKREDRFRGRTLGDVLGEFDKSWAELAREIRKEVGSDNGKSGEPGKARALYYGRKVFVNMWSGDTRAMLRIALGVLEQLPGNGEMQLPIDKRAQDKVFRRTGGEYLHLLEACTRTKRDRPQKLPAHIMSWGKHMVKIAEGFKQIALHELKTRGGGREGRGDEPKQAFRIEIVDQFSLDGIQKELYEDLVRYGIFLRDDRGKSIRGAIIPRLYLRRLLIPFCTLTFSKIDNVPMKASDFKEFLLHPEEIAVAWKKDKTRFDKKQRGLFG